MLPSGCIEKQASGSQSVQNPARLGRSHFPDTGGLGGRKGLDWEPGDERRFLLAHQDPQNAAEGGGIRRALGKAIQPADQMIISGPRVEMGQRISPRSNLSALRSAVNGMIRATLLDSLTSRLPHAL